MQCAHFFVVIKIGDITKWRRGWDVILTHWTESGTFRLPGRNLDVYVERLEEYLLVNDVKEEQHKKVAKFLTLVGSSTYQVLRDLLTPNAPASKSLKELLDVLKGHYKPTRLVIAEYFSFHCRSQESTTQYMAVL